MHVHVHMCLHVSVLIENPRRCVCVRCVRCVCVCVTRAKIMPMRVLKVSKETYRGKRETNYRGQIDLLQRQKRPTTEAKETYV